jgi:hypothetical protein
MLVALFGREYRKVEVEHAVLSGGRKIVGGDEAVEQGGKRGCIEGEKETPRVLDVASQLQ